MFNHIDHTNSAGNTTLFTIGATEDAQILAQGLVSSRGGNAEVTPVDLPRIQPGQDADIHLQIPGAHFYECTLSLPQVDRVFILAGTLGQVETYAKTLLMQDNQPIAGAQFSLYRLKDRVITTIEPIIDTARALINPANIPLSLVER